MEKEIKNLEDSQAEKVASGAINIYQKFPTIEECLLNEYHMRLRCLKCGKQMTDTGDGAYIDHDGKLVVHSQKIYCPHCGYERKTKQ